MKIKMTSCVISNKGTAYNHSCEFIVGKSIEKDFAMNLVKANFARIIKEDETEVKAEKPKVAKQRQKRGKINEI